MSYPHRVPQTLWWPRSHPPATPIDTRVCRSYSPPHIAALWAAAREPVSKHLDVDHYPHASELRDDRAVPEPCARRRHAMQTLGREENGQVPSKTKRVVVDHYGGPEVLNVVEEDVPRPGRA